MWLPVAPAGDPLFRLLYNPSIKLLIPGICLLEPSRFLDLYTQPNPIKAQLCNTLNADRPGHAHLKEIKLLDAPIGKQDFEEEQFKIFTRITTNIEDDLSQSPTAIPILTPADKIVDILHQHQATLLPWNSIPKNLNCNRAPT